MPLFSEALSQIFPPAEGDLCYSQASSVQRALQVRTVQLDILYILRRESALRADADLTGLQRMF